MTLGRCGGREKQGGLGCDSYTHDTYLYYSKNILGKPSPDYKLFTY